MKITGIISLVLFLAAAIPAGGYGPFVDRGDGGVLDQGTGLMWVRDASALPFTSADGAEDFCGNLDAAGYNDWRLPRIDELATITDYEAPTGATYPVFGDTPAGKFWSGTTRVDDPDSGWAIDSGSGVVAAISRSSDGYVRCVRGGPFWEQDTARRLVVESAETALDAHTGLQWQRATFSPRVGWEEALGYCDQLVSDGYDDWRLPAIEELQAVVDYGHVRPAADPAVFATEPYYYWSSTERAVYDTSAWQVLFATGAVGSADKGSKAWVRCVRDVRPEAAAHPADCPDPIQVLNESLGLRNLYPDPDGAVHAVPNFISRKQLLENAYRVHRLAAAAYTDARKSGQSRREAVKAYKAALKDRSQPVVLSGYLVNRLALLLGLETIPAAYLMIGDVRVDLKNADSSVLDAAGYFSIETRVDGSRGDGLEVRLFAEAPDGAEVLVDSTRIVFED